MIIRQAKTWQRLSKIAIRVFEVERELFTHFLTLIVLVGLIGSAAYMDSRLQPKTAEAGAVKTAAAQPSPAAQPAAPAPPAADAQPAPPAAPPAPTGPPALTQSTQGLSPELLGRFDAFRSFIWVKYGVTLEIRSGYRSTEEQAHLYATLPAGRANPPGHSNHEKGEAIDYTNYSPEYNQYLGQFGLHAPFPGKEDWHIERVETPTVR